MFIPNQILNINANDRVLEIGPGAFPHPRANVLLDKMFDEDEASAQRGHLPAVHTGKELVYYDGDRFPFDDKSFDYVICSHVLEHVENVPSFLNELTRVASRGYLEFPTVLYEYLYNFRVHQNLIHYADGELRWLSKKKLPFDEFLPVQTFFHNSLGAGYDEIVVSMVHQMFEGFEWHTSIPARESNDLREMCPDASKFHFPPNPLKPPPTRSLELIKELLRRASRRLLGRS